MNREVIKYWLGREGKRNIYKKIPVEISEEVFEVFEESRLQDIRGANEKRRHRTQQAERLFLELPDPYSLEEHAESRDKLAKVFDVLDGCTEAQRTRFILNTVHCVTFREIADVQSCSPRAVKDSVDFVWSKLMPELGEGESDKIR